MSAERGEKNGSSRCRLFSKHLVWMATDDAAIRGITVFRKTGQPARLALGRHKMPKKPRARDVAQWKSDCRAPGRAWFESLVLKQTNKETKMQRPYL